LLLSSRVYRLSSAPGQQQAAIDPGNQYYWRHDRVRLDAEAIRDAMLVASGQLDLARPDAHPFPTIEKWNWTQHQPFKAVYPSNHRSVYLMTQRIQRHPYLALFDGPDTNNSTEARTSATVPLQALYVLNDSFVHEQADGFARRVLAATANPTQRLDLAVRIAWGRAPHASELDKMTNYLERYRRELSTAGKADGESESQAWGSLARILLASNEFIYVD
jgi:hypothetical protein